MSNKRNNNNKRKNQSSQPAVEFSPRQELRDFWKRAWDWNSSYWRTIWYNFVNPAKMMEQRLNDKKFIVPSLFHLLSTITLALVIGRAVILFAELPQNDWNDIEMREMLDRQYGPNPTPAEREAMEKSINTVDWANRNLSGDLRPFGMMTIVVLSQFLFSLLMMFLNEKYKYWQWLIFGLLTIASCLLLAFVGEGIYYSVAAASSHHHAETPFGLVLILFYWLLPCWLYSRMWHQEGKQRWWKTPIVFIGWPFIAVVLVGVIFVILTMAVTT